MVRASDFGPWFEHDAVRCGLEQVTFTTCLVLVKPRKRWTDDQDGQTVTRLETTLCIFMLSPRELVSRHDNMDETVPHAVSNSLYIVHPKSAKEKLMCDF